MSKRIFITGLGTISSVGNNVSETLISLKNSKTGIGKMRHLTSVHREFPVGEVRHSNDELASLLGFPTSSGYSRGSLLGMIAAKEACQNARLEHSNLPRTGIISATTVGGMDRTELHACEFLDLRKTPDSLQYIGTHDAGESTERIADFLGIKDYITTISTACSSSANSIMLGARLIKNNLLDRVVAGGTDALSIFTLNGFNTLMIHDHELCRPFDETRRGLNLGEGAGFVVLESEETAKGKPIFCELTGYANTNDAYHQTASSPDGSGAYMAMKKALDMSGLSADEIDYINVHGTGTENNDLSEGRAMEKLFGKNNPAFSSTKSFTGHTLAAAGGIEAVFSALAIQNQLIYPNMNFVNPMKEFNLKPVTQLMQKVKVRNVLSNSFGFGGNNSTLVFSEV